MLTSKPRKKYECSICNQKYSKIEEIRAHIKATHLVHVTCPLCDKLFPNKLELLTHRKSHFQAAPDCPSTSKQNELISQSTTVNSKEADGESSSTPLREESEVGPPDNHEEVMLQRSIPCHFNDCVSTSDVEFTTDQEASCGQESARSPFSPNDKNAQGAIFSNCLPRQGEGDTIEYSPKVNKKGSGDISFNSFAGSSLWNHLNVTSIGATPKLIATRSYKVNSTETSHISVTIDSDDYEILPVREVKYVQKPDYVEMPIDLINTFLKKNLDHIKCKSKRLNEYNCEICDKKYDNMESIQSHIRETHTSPLICLICNEKFSNRSQYLNHATSHLKDSSAPPEERKFHNGNSEDLPERIENATPPKVEENVISREVGKRKSSKFRKAKEYACKLCQEKYTCVQDVRTHVKKVHLTDLTCSLCDKIFANKHSLIDHAKSHFGEIPKSSNTQSDDSNSKCLNMPFVNESEEKCTSMGETSVDYNDCGISDDGKCVTSDAATQESYLGGQTNEVECHKCDVCCLFFDTASALTLHQETHKIVTYKCGVCEFASSSKECVLTHLHEELHSFISY